MGRTSPIGTATKKEPGRRDGDALQGMRWSGVWHRPLAATSLGTLGNRTD